MTQGYQKISANLSDEVLAVLKDAAAREQITLTEALRRAISTYKAVDDAEREGKHILFRDPATKEIERVIFR